jgi:hypothetical protein
MILARASSRRPCLSSSRARLIEELLNAVSRHGYAEHQAQNQKSNSHDRPPKFSATPKCSILAEVAAF